MPRDEKDGPYPPRHRAKAKVCNVVTKPDYSLISKTALLHNNYNYSATV